MKRFLILFAALLFATPTFACDHYSRLYGAATTVDLNLWATDGTALKVDASCASGDVKIMKDEGDEGNATNCFTDEGQGYSLALKATELQAARVVVYVVDQGTKAWLDKCLIIETYGNASAQHTNIDVNVASISSDSTAADNLEAMFDGTGYAGGTVKLGVDVIAVSGGTSAATNLEAAYDGTGYAGGAIKPEVNLYSISGGTTAVSNLANAYNGTGYAGGSIKQQVDIYSVSGGTSAATNLEAAYDGTGYVGGTIKQSVSVADIATDAITATSIAANAITASEIAADAITSSELAATAAAEIADVTLRRNSTNVEASSDGDTLNFQSLYGSVAKQTNNMSVVGGTLVIKKADGVTTFDTQTITSDASAAPITGLAN